MNKRQVIVLWVIALALGITVSLVKISQNQVANSTTKRSPGQLFFDNFPATETASIEIKGASATTSLTRKQGGWTVNERDAYPAKNSFVNDLLRTLSEVKVTQGKEAGPSFAPRFGMDDTATTPEEHGYTISFKDSSGKEIAKVSVGKTIEPNKTGQEQMGGAVGRYIRNHADTSAFYAVSEMFPSLTDSPKSWLNDTFINAENIKTNTHSSQSKADPDWIVSRDSETAEFKLNGPNPNELLDTTIATTLKTLLAYASFDDVVPQASLAERITPDSQRSVILETFDGFIYKLTIALPKPMPAPAAPSDPSTSEEAILTINDITAELAKERVKAADEKPEDAKSKDGAFTQKMKSLSDRLAQEKSLIGKTYEVAKSGIEPFLKSRADLIAKPTPPEEPAPNAALQQLPGGMIANPPTGRSATSRPVEAYSSPVSATGQ